MLDLAVNGYTREQVMQALHASGGHWQTKIRYELLNRHDIKIGELTATGGSITFNSEAEIKRIANFTVKETNDIDWLNDRIRPVFCLRMPDGGWAEWPLGVFLISSPRRTEKNVIMREIEAYDPCVILKEDKFDNRYLIPTGMTYTAAITQILNDAGITKVNITAHDGTIGADKEFEIGTDKLSAVNQLLGEINYTSIWVDTNGYFVARPYIIPSERDAEYEYRTDDLSIIEHGATEEVDLFGVPNKWVVVCSTPDKAVLVSQYVNDLPTSRTSTISRGRVITDFRQVDDILDQETLDEYTKRIAYNDSWVYEKLNFSTLPMPHHDYLNCLYIDHKLLGAASKYIETSWTIDLNGQMTHNCRRVIRI